MTNSDAPGGSPAEVIDRLVGRVWRRAWLLQAVYALGWALLVLAGVRLAADAAAAARVPSANAAMGGWVALVCAAAAGAWILIRGRMGRVEAAHAVDRRLDLKDRVVSALEFAHARRPHPVHQLQIADAEVHLRGARPAVILPWRWRRDSTLLAAAAILWGMGRLLPGAGEAQAMAPAPAPPSVARESHAIQQSIEELAETLDGEADPDIVEALEEARKLAEAMREPGTGMDEAFELMGRIRAELQQAAQALDLEQNRAMLEAWANALNASPHTQAAGKSLADQQYLEAAAAMDELARQAAEDMSSFAEQSEALAQEAARLAGEAMEQGLMPFSEALGDLSDGVRGLDAEQTRGALQRQAGQMRRHGMREAMAQQLRQQLSALAEAGRNLSGMELAAGRPLSTGAPQQRPPEGDTSVGAGADDNPFGEATALEDAEMTAHQLRGQRTGGDSQFAIEQGAPTQQMAGQDYREVYSRYRKLSDAVLAQESLPSGYQPIIRRYFESIRPQRAEPEE